ncbi:MAG: repeat-containing protein, partial [Cytophagaceae bacterium]|nr:repeat-containing protein [Cytophagaceae bacterium]
MPFLFCFLGCLFMSHLAFAQINSSYFPFKDTYSVRGLLSDVAVLNLNKDNLPDALVCDFNNNNITPFYNIGGCPNSLSQGISITTDNGPVTIETADFNQDGRQDFVVLNSLSHTLCVYKNHISPEDVVTILPFGTYMLTDSCNALLANDVDGDGKPDLLITHGSSGLVYVLKNTSTTQTIQFDQPALLFTTGLNLKGLCTADFNGDGKSDLVLAGELNGGHLFLCQNQSSPGNLSFLTPIDHAIDISPTVIKSGDIDADGKMDLVVGGLQNGSLLMLHNECSGGPLSLHSFASPLYFQTLGGIIDIELTDLNDDHQLDVVALHPSKDSLTVWTNTGHPGIWNENIFLSAEKLWSGEGPLALCIKDLNGDGRKDILHTNQEFRNLVVQYKKNTVRGSTTMTFPASAANYYSRYNPGDFVLTGIGSGILTWYADSSLHQLMGAGNQFHTPWLERTDTFYVTNSESCNESDPIAVIAAIRCSIMPPKPLSAYRCGAGSLTLAAISNEQICWYKKL